MHLRYQTLMQRLPSSFHDHLSNPATSRMSIQTITSSPERQTQEVCVICLDALSLDTRAITPCNHWFDFLCIASWLEQNPNCPLCKSPVTKLEYDWRSGRDCLTYIVPKPSVETQKGPASPSSPHRLQQPRGPARWSYVDNRYHHSSDGGSLSHHSSLQGVSTNAQPTRQQFRSFGHSSTRTSPSSTNRTPRRYSTQSSNPQNGKRRPDPFANPPLPEPLAIQRRREIYKRNLFSLHVGTNPRSRYMDVSASSIAKYPSLQSKARMWIRRELQIFEWISQSTHTPQSSSSSSSSSNSNYGNTCDDDSNINSSPSNISPRKPTLTSPPAFHQNTEFLLEYILSILKTIDIKDSEGRALSAIAEFVGHQNAAIFLHECESWLRSPFGRLEDWDRVVRYSEDI